MKEQPLDPLRLVLVGVDSTTLDCWEVYNMLLACAQAPYVTAYGAELITLLYGKQAESVCELLHPRFCQRIFYCVSKDNVFLFCGSEKLRNHHLNLNGCH